MPFEVLSPMHNKDVKRDELAVQRAILRNQQVISDWFDGDIIPGTEWGGQDILQSISAGAQRLSFCSSAPISPWLHPCWDIEMKEALARHEAGQARVIPILLRPTDWHDAPLRPTPGAACTWQTRQQVAHA